MRSRLSELVIPDIWKAFRRQSWSFWLLCGYFFLEYVRPQSIWRTLDILPWGQIVLVACTAAVILENKVRLKGPLSGLLLVYSAVVVLSSFSAYEFSVSLDGWKLFLNWVLVFYLTISVIDTEERFFVFMLLFLLWNFKMSQHAMRSWASAGFGFRGWGVTGAPGWFHNSGEFGIQMTMFFPLSVYFMMSFWKSVGLFKRLCLLALPITCVAGIVGSSSRGALLGLVAVCLVFLLQSRRVKVAVGVLVLLVGSALAIPERQWERFDQMGEDRTSQARLTYWRHGIEIANDHPLLGVGYDNWLPYYVAHYSGQSNLGLQEPHNIFIEAVAELGYMGLLVFLLLIGGTFTVNWRTRRLCRRVGANAVFLRNMAFGLDAALVGFLTSGFFVTVLYYPFFWVNLATTVALHLAARDRVRRGLSETGHRSLPVRGLSVGRVKQSQVAS